MTSGENTRVHSNGLDLCKSWMNKRAQKVLITIFLSSVTATVLGSVFGGLFDLHSAKSMAGGAVLILISAGSGGLLYRITRKKKMKQPKPENTETLKPQEEGVKTKAVTETQATKQKKSKKPETMLVEPPSGYRVSSLPNEGQNWYKFPLEE